MEDNSEPDYYDLLNVTPAATTEEIITSYRELSKIYHPDKGDTMNAFLQIKKAYDVLTSTELRYFYDKYGLKGVEAAQAEMEKNNEVSASSSLSTSNSILANPSKELKLLEKNVIGSMRNVKEIEATQLISSNTNFVIGLFSDYWNPLRPRTRPARNRINYTALSHTMKVRVSDVTECEIGLDSQNQCTKMMGIGRLSFGVVHRLTPGFSSCILLSFQGPNLLHQGQCIFDYRLSKDTTIRTIPIYVPINKPLSSTAATPSLPSPSQDLPPVLGLTTEVTHQFDKHWNGSLCLGIGQSEVVRVGSIFRKALYSFKGHVETSPNDVELMMRHKYKVTEELNAGVTISLSLATGPQVALSLTYKINQWIRMLWDVTFRMNSIEVAYTFQRLNTTVRIPIEVFTHKEGALIKMPSLAIPYMALYLSVPTLIYVCQEVSERVRAKHEVYENEHGEESSKVRHYWNFLKFVFTQKKKKSVASVEDRRREERRGEERRREERRGETKAEREEDRKEEIEIEYFNRAQAEKKALKKLSERIKEKELASNGLIIVQALYGSALQIKKKLGSGRDIKERGEIGEIGEIGDIGEGEKGRNSCIYDVTDIIQAKTRNGKLVISNQSKKHLPGFFASRKIVDNLVLFIKYSFGAERTYYQFFADEDPVILP